MTEESVKVVIRMRPLTERQQNHKTLNFMEFDKNEKLITIWNPNSDHQINKIFSFDELFLEDSTQQQIFEATGKKMVNAVIQGYNGTIFAYGQTNSGKTFTMMGNKKQQQKGIIPRCFEKILEHAKFNSNKDFLVRCSFIELYNEEIRDLLSTNFKQKLQLRQSPQNGIFIKDVLKMSVTTEQQMDKYLQIGNQNRTIGQTFMNSQSSRSHSIFTIYVQSLERKQGIEKLVGSKFNLVDLAGSQRQSKTGSTGQRFLQATKINLSLTALGKVISTLVEGKGSHIPYRDSKLTRLLQDSLGGNAKTIMIATASSSFYNYEQTISTLKYASRAKYITNAPKINEDPKDALLRQYQNQIKRLRGELKNLQQKQRPSMDQIIYEKQKITKKAQQEKKQLIEKIKQLEEQFISPSDLSKKLLDERNLREQKLSFMEINYKSLEEQVRQMKILLTQLRRKYKNASKQIFQLQNQHEIQKLKIQQQFITLQKQNCVYKSVLNVLFTQKQLNNIISLGSWQNQRNFKLPVFYFKDRYTLAFPCSATDDIYPDKPLKQNPNNYLATTNGFRSTSQQKIVQKKRFLY